ncbi:ParB N-terminal domain-containing protein, partial [Comamonas odontotermitis]|uniref:ParB N-terminal domain-containing protein n=1 Tax=Comamonas odontotermitis TaxID=379895 RepID=UPI00366C8D52
MSKQHHATELKMIPLEQIAVLNPRDRNGRVFQEIVGNIKSIGLKKPVTVTPRDDLEDGKQYLLICGEGRLTAFKTIGEQQIPALVVKVSDEDAFIMSLSENIARRAYRPLELLAGIEQLLIRHQTFELLTYRRVGSSMEKIDSR